MQMSKENEAIQPEIEGNMRRLRDKMLGDGISKNDADRLLSNVIISTKISDDDANEIESIISSAAQITNGKGAFSLQSIIQTDDRAYANRYGDINIGASVKQEVLYHEFGHHVEYESDAVRLAALDFIKRRATGEPKTLNEIIKSDEYDANEIAYPDNFVNPYVGKIYKSNTTEVVAVGLEHFTSSRDMLELYQTDREHFEFMLGVLR